MNLTGLTDLTANLVSVVEHEMEWLDPLDDVAIVRFKLPKSETVIKQHVHSYDHWTIVTKPVKVWVGEQFLGILTGPVVIKKHMSHMFMTLEPDTEIFCIQNTHGKGIEIE